MRHCFSSKPDLLPFPCPAKVNEALSENNGEALDFSMRQELEQVLRGGQRIAGAMARWVPHVGPLISCAAWWGDQ